MKIDSWPWGDLLALGCIPAEGAEYDIFHLQKRRYRLVLKKTSKRPELRCTYSASYTSHCVSRGSRQGEVPGRNIPGNDPWITDEKGIDRCFDPLRWTFSHFLPRILETLPIRQCVRVSRRLWLTTEKVEIEGEIREYEIYFKINKLDKRTLRIRVVSAYVRDPNFGETKPKIPKPRRQLRGETLLAKTLRGEPIR